MAQKPEPRTAKGISNLAAAMAAGIDEEPGLVTFISKAEMAANRLAFNTAEANFNAGRLALSNANKTSQAAEVALFDWLGAAKSVFAASFGLYWSTEWAAAGFINNSTAIPKEIGERIGLTEDIVEFLTANPTYQVTSLNVTIDYGSDVHASAVAGQKAVSDAEMARDGLETARQGARTTVIAGMRGLIKNLDAKLGPMDPRWLAKAGSPGHSGETDRSHLNSDGNRCAAGDLRCDAAGHPLSLADARGRTGHRV